MSTKPDHDSSSNKSELELLNHAATSLGYSALRNVNIDAALVAGQTVRLTIVTSFIYSVDQLVDCLELFNFEIDRENTHDRNALLDFKSQTWNILDRFRVATTLAYRDGQYWARFRVLAEEVRFVIRAFHSEINSLFEASLARMATDESGAESSLEFDRENLNVRLARKSAIAVQALEEAEAIARDTRERLMRLRGQLRELHGDVYQSLVAAVGRLDEKCQS